MTQLEHLLNSNAIPSLLQTTYIQNIIFDELATQVTLEKEILKARTPRIDALVHQLDKSRTKVNLYRRVISVVRRIPQDILEQIFICYASSNLSRPPTITEIFPVTHICSLWRQVAINAGRLWASMHFELRPYNFYTFPECLREIWKRTHSMPLCLSIIFIPADAASMFDFRKFRLALPPQSEYLKELELAIPPALILALLEKSSLARLETLTIDLGIFEVLSEDPLNTLTVFNSLGRLREIRYSSYDVFGYYPIRLPWSQLTFLDIGGVGGSPSAIILILAECKNLVDCHLFINHEGWDFPDSSIIVLPNLQKLRVDGYWATTSSQFFMTFYLPNLKNLTTSSANSYNRIWRTCWNTLRSFQMQSQFDLTTLSLLRPLISLEDLRRLIAMSPSLTHLQLGSDHYGRIMPEFLELLTYDPEGVEQDIVAPCLEALFIEYEDLEYFGDAEWEAEVVKHAIAMVRSRWRPQAEAENSNVACLRTLIIRFTPSLDIIYEALHDCCDQGFYLSDNFQT